MQWIIALNRHVQSLPERQRVRVGKTFVSLSLSSSLLPSLSPSPPSSLLEVHGKLPVRSLCVFAGGRCYSFFTSEGGKNHFEKHKNSFVLVL